MITDCKCGSPVEAKLDVDTDKVMCQECGDPIENISEFAKAQMKQSGDIVRNDALHKVPEGGMVVECGKCQKSIVALLNKKDDTAYCPKCGEAQKLSSYATALLRENGQYEGSVKEEDVKGEDLDLESEAGVNQPTTPPVNAGVVTIDENGGMPVVKAPEDPEPEITLIPPQNATAAAKAEAAKPQPEKTVTAEDKTVTTEAKPAKKKRGRPPKKKD